MKQKSALIIFIIGTIGILATMISFALDNPNSPFLSGLSTFKYFTILSNLFVVIYFGLIYFLKMERFPFFNQMFGGVVVYITITFIVFAVAIQGTWHPIGLEKIGTILNHYVVPILTIAFLIYYRDHYEFRKNDMFLWIIFPILYGIFVIIHGAITSDYIYPFFEIDDIGFGHFFLAFCSILVLFFALSFGTILISRPKKNK